MDRSGRHNRQVDLYPTPDRYQRCDSYRRSDDDRRSRLSGPGRAASANSRRYGERSASYVKDENFRSRYRRRSRSPEASPTHIRTPLNRTDIRTERSISPRSRARSQTLTPRIRIGQVDRPVLSELPSDYSQCISAFTASSRQLIQHNPIRDHISQDKPIFHDAFKVAAQGSIDLMTRLRHAIADPNLGLKLPDHLITALQQAYMPWISEPVRVVVMGDIGHGKSALVAALLDDANVVKEVSSNHSMACFIC